MGRSDGSGYTNIQFQRNFSLSGLAEGSYLFKVEGDNTQPVFGAVHLSADESHRISVVSRSAGLTGQSKGVGAAAPLRESVRPALDLTKPPKVKAAKIKKTVIPAYPIAERNAGVEGAVKVAMIILPDGTVNDLVVLSAPTANLAVAALLAVQPWLYSPTYLDGQPVEANLTVDVLFQHP